MYDFLRGRVAFSQPGLIVLDVGGIGFKIHTPDHASADLKAAGQELKLWTHLHFKEDNLSLYGFLNRQERELFLSLIKVSGVGPKLATQILSGIRPEELVRAMAEENWKRLTLISGIGPKTAKRLLIELKERLTSQELEFLPSDSISGDPVLAQAINALQNLGFDRDRIRSALQGVSPDQDLESIIRIALAKLSA